MSDKIGYVVLHYATLEETANCVKSIVDTQKGAEYCIIVVNNGDGREEELENECSGLSREIVFLESKTNNGFARGMNLGFEEAKYRRHCDFIVLLNNDTRMVQSDFSTLLIDEYHQNAYAVAGPQVLRPDGVMEKRSVPHPSDGSNFGHVLFKSFMMSTKYVASFIDQDLRVAHLEHRLERQALRMSKKAVVTPPVSLDRPRLSDCVLHGSCMIFSPQYVQKYDGLNPGTFLYVEEEILYARVRANRWMSAYLNNLTIIHMGSVATDTLVHTKKEKRRFKYRHQIRSYHVLIGELLAQRLRRQPPKAGAGVQKSL